MLKAMAAKGLILYLLTASSLALLSVHFVTNYSTDDGTAEPSFRSSSNSTVLLRNYGSEAKVWPELKFSWRVVLATVIGFLGSACGTVGGVGGGGIFVPMLTLIIGFDTKSAAAISKCKNEAYELRICVAVCAFVPFVGGLVLKLRYDNGSVSIIGLVQPAGAPLPIIDYDLALLFQPMLMLGITVGVALSVVFPYWLITVLIIILFLGTSSRSFGKAIEMWKDESVLKKAMDERHITADPQSELILDTDYQLLIPQEQKTTLNETRACSTLYWILNILQFPVALAVFGYECVKLYKESKKRRMAGNPELICEAAIEWTAANLAFCALCGVVGGTVGGLLGSGGGFVLGPLLLEIGVIPQVASATATFVMMFSSSLSVVEFYLLNRFPIPYALYMMGVSILAGFWGQFLVRKLIAILKRASIIVFILSGVIFASAVTMGIVGIEKSIDMINKHEFMGFLDFCSSQ
ncbi:Sulfite exporter TauE/SafE family protein 4 [Sesamum angolense]|uniref:Sulfite exporter TauE/SafE family protein 4 n=1 Tax=Sesamum angolense TaxID=2727404 RepID=A0AAE1WFH7_9LAMI|nr:Sulfite exporter TauE/SafE family protein 4 [Sesamum angolense]